jgi:hypothetical protein
MFKDLQGNGWVVLMVIRVNEFKQLDLEKVKICSKLPLFMMDATFDPKVMKWVPTAP